MTYTVIYEQGPIFWGAYVPDLPGVIALDDSVERSIREAVEFQLERVHAQGLRFLGRRAEAHRCTLKRAPHNNGGAGVVRRK